MLIDILNKDDINIVYYKAGILREERFDDITKIDVNLLKKSKEVIILVPDSFLITKVLNIPVDIKSFKAIKSNLYKNLPVSPNLTYNKVGIVGSKLYFTGIKKENIDPFLQYFNKLKINKKYVLANSLAIKEVYNFDKPNYIILNLTPYYLSVCSFEKLGYFFFSVLPYNIDNFKLDPNDLQANKIVNEIYRIISSFQTQTKLNIEGVYFFANIEYSELKLLDLLRKSLGNLSFVLRKDNYYPLYEKLLDLLRKSLGNLSFVLRQDNYYPLYEKILSYKSFPISLDKDELEEKANIEENKEIFSKFLVVYIITFILILLITYFLMNKKYNNESIILSNLQSTYNSLKLSSLSNSSQEDKYVEKAVLIIYKLNRIDKEVLKEIYFNSISYNKGIFVLNFTCFNYDSVLKFQNALKENLKDIATISNVQSNKKIITVDNENQVELIDNAVEIQMKN